MKGDFTKVYIVRKLNHADGPIVKTVAAQVVRAAQYIGHLVIDDVTKIDKDTLIVAVGGDGTMLEAMRLAVMKEAIATGINLGKVGFLTDFANAGLLYTELLELFDDSCGFPLESRIAITANRVGAEGNDFPIPVFNEFVLSNVSSDEIITYRLRIDNVDAGEHRANAVIVGTPTGSTAYTLSNGGSLLYPSMNVMQIVPVAPLSLSSRPIIVPGNAEISISIKTDGTTALKGDGIRVCEFRENQDIDVSITGYKNPVRILHTKDWNFFNMLTDKLGWKKL